MKELVRKAHYRDQKSKRVIARELGSHRDTVCRLLNVEAGSLPQFKRTNWISPVMGPFIPIIEAWLKEDCNWQAKSVTQHMFQDTSEPSIDKGSTDRAL